MVDAVGMVTKIVEIALRIKEAVDMVHQNKEECLEIKKRVDIVRHTLSSRCEIEAELMKDPAVRDALKALSDVLREAFQLVIDCQEETNVACLFCKAGKLSQQLCRVDKRISKINLDAGFAIISPVPLQEMQTYCPPQEVQYNYMLLVGKTLFWAPQLLSDFSFGSPGPEKFECFTLDFMYLTNLLLGLCNGFTKFRLFELETATNKFSQDNMITQDSFATVYKGVLPDRRKVAIRKFHDRQSEDQKQHLVHYATLFSVLRQHDNIVRLVGYCQETSVEIMPSEGKFVPVESRDMMAIYWHTSFRIILGVAQGVVYLHTKNIIHMDLKPGNILLDYYMTPRISGFEISNTVDPEYPAMQMGEIIGTPGYMPPEYVESGVISVKNDVYSFGARDRLECQDLRVSFDPSICNESQVEEVERCIRIRLLCVAKEREERPTMADVVEMLRGSNDKFPAPSNSGSRNAARLLGPDQDRLSCTVTAQKASWATCLLLIWSNV
ncbi:hypothetical protein BRADI_4g10360v3 [Brachypodium distachyon]|uniref:Protein kinase domain-containing protein n=1 Tax=Brachypodium distachyon TaxID=15368 RepID=A0A0Q3HG02_BRADI|nr:hypothetical protein BRADI_4g10360v3 [Brachypodium distachyon]